MKETKRLDEIDILKSIGIILMIMGHTGFGKIFDYYIHSFHMPMFYIISGFLYKNSQLPFKDFLKKKSKSLLIPYIIFAFFHLISWYILCFIVGRDLSIVNLISIFTFNTDNMPISGALWFLTSLFFVDIIYYFINRINDKKFKLLTVVIISMIGCIIPRYFRLPWALDTSLMGIGLYYIGHLYRKNNKKGDNWPISIICLVLGSILTFLNGYINVRQGLYSNIFLYYIVAALMTLGFYGFSRIICHFNSLIINELKFIGKNSLVYVCLNQLFLLVLNKLGTLFLNNLLLLLVYKMCSLIIVLGILHIATIMLNMNQTKWIVGK